MKKSASANAVKIDTKKLKQFLAKRRWQIPSLSACVNYSGPLTDDEILEKSVNALVAVRRLSSLASLMNVKSRPSIAPSLATVASANEEEEETADDGALQEDKEQELVRDIVDMALEENIEQISIKPPVFTKELSDISINEGETVSFEVGIENDSNCHLEWLKNGVKVTEGERFSLVNHGEGGYSLTIRDTQDDDSGEYHCVAENEAGRVTCGGKLSIECK
ncbi:myopalladin-like isoform X2 [Orbicella faveolata]|uniref:myopalladin-like isoform X2 n=1 Tax=Orbicella faveolata TaxID=48498 RepID=UPI0009E528E5|nr:myopalladin-like isoform X2 [Orbicella faveolata]